MCHFCVFGSAWKPWLQKALCVTTLEVWGPGETRKNTFVFIGRDLDKEYLVGGFKKCQVVSKTLRFAVGDKVVANVGTWEPGTVTHASARGSAGGISGRSGCSMDGVALYVV